MKSDDALISEFGLPDIGSFTAASGVDFSLARKLARSGSTCEAWEAVVQRRRVFVKRLKPEFRADALHRAAFEKEFDVGVRLCHPSLPQYIALHDDYIVMNYIEGDTLADLFNRDDNRLHYKEFTHRLLAELLDAIEYLHNAGAVHCDVKADNIIVSPHRDHPAALIDLDKAYTPWLDSTYGEPAKYDCEGVADGRIDFMGLATVAESLGWKQFARACRRSDVSAIKLRRELLGKRRLWIIPVVVLLLLSFAAAILYFSRKANESSQTFHAYNVPVEEVTDGETDGNNADEIVNEIPDSPRSTKPENVTKGDEPDDVDFSLLSDSRIEQPSIQEFDSEYIGWMIQENTVGLAETRARLLQLMATRRLNKDNGEGFIENYLELSAGAQAKIIDEVQAYYSGLSKSEVEKAVRSHPSWIQLADEDVILLDTFRELE